MSCVNKLLNQLKEKIICMYEDLLYGICMITHETVSNNRPGDLI